jgi:hypothetical protein
MYTQKILNRSQKLKIATEWRHKNGAIWYTFYEILTKILLYLDSITNF